MKKAFHIVLLFLISACRKDVQLKLPDYQPKVVIEGSIETGSQALVLLSWAVPYFGNFDFNTPQNSFIKGAFVTVSDGFTTDTLRELQPTLGYVYTGSKITGIQGRTYTLKVTVEEKTFTTESTILNPASLNKLFFKGEFGDLGFLWQNFSEPAGSGDNYRWFSKRLHRDQFYAAPFNSVFDDKFIDGKTFDFAYDRGKQPSFGQAQVEDPERGYYRKGDTVVVKFCKIGRKEFIFWDTYYQNKISNSNPFSSPTNVSSMFEDYEHAFGAFVAYSPSFDTIIIPAK